MDCMPAILVTEQDYNKVAAAEAALLSPVSLSSGSRRAKEVVKATKYAIRQQSASLLLEIWRRERQAGRLSVHSVDVVSMLEPSIWDDDIDLQRFLGQQFESEARAQILFLIFMLKSSL